MLYLILKGRLVALLQHHQVCLPQDSKCCIPCRQHRYKTLRSRLWRQQEPGEVASKTSSSVLSNVQKPEAEVFSLSWKSSPKTIERNWKGRASNGEASQSRRMPWLRAPSSIFEEGQFSLHEVQQGFSSISQEEPWARRDPGPRKPCSPEGAANVLSNTTGFGVISLKF